eukprot:s8423_g4.t1
MALLSEAFALGTAPPALPISSPCSGGVQCRYASQPGAVHEPPERGASLALAAAAAAVAAGVVARRRPGKPRAAALALWAQPSDLPPLPPLPPLPGGGKEPQAEKSALPPLPPLPPVAGEAPKADEATLPALPPLPDGGAKAEKSALPPLPPLPPLAGEAPKAFCLTSARHHAEITHCNR